ncbi:MAG: zinc ribbon domain-containing protein [Anaerolineales bacterium]|nr:zinc ribbon domain-containing protein [Anaerolineales bacterium]
MDLGSLFFLIGILLLVIVYIIQPFTRQRPYRMAADEKKISSLLAEQERVINTLLELDFDYHLGKIPEEDYPIHRSVLLAQGAQIMQQLDILRAEYNIWGVATDGRASDKPREIPSTNKKARRERGTKRLLATPDDDIEILLAARRRERIEKAGGFCPQCGNPIQQSDRFCPSCGEALMQENNLEK